MRRFAGTILALDLASVTGWACGAPGQGVPRSGSIRFARVGASMGAIFSGCAQWLRDFLTVQEVSLIVFESPMEPGFMTGKTNASTIRVLMGLPAIVEATVYGDGY